MSSTAETTGTLLDVDARGRISVGRLADAPHYLARKEGDTIVLEPAVIITAAQARLNQTPGLAARLVDAMDHPERAVPRRRR